ncbi:hypothetical protein [Micropruina sp.]|uniref:hypothetical protein n=1 Tax=Micropruina sp. TaxID=2737536 RepID=UPI0039E71074
MPQRDDRGLDELDQRKGSDPLALTDCAEANAAVVVEADSRLTFCVRGDRADERSWTPASGHVAG